MVLTASLKKWAKAHQARLEELMCVLALLPFAALFGAVIVACEESSRKSELEWQRAIDAAQKWGNDCRASGGYVHQEKWVEEVPFRKKAQRYVTHTRTYCVRPAAPTADATATPAIPLKPSKRSASSQNNPK